MEAWETASSLMKKSKWKLSPENASPKARELMSDKFFWSLADDNSPFGNDTGADVLEFYRRWREHDAYASPSAFLSDLMYGPFDAPELMEVNLSASPTIDSPDVSVLTESIIAITFAQLVLEGVIDPRMRKLALWAVSYESHEILLNRWYTADLRSERQYRLERMKQVIEAV